MGKRVVTVFVILCFMSGFTILRLFTLITGEYAQIGAMNSSMSLEVSQSRGYIYDCKMRALVNTREALCAAVKPEQQAASKLQKVLSAEKFEYVYSRLGKGYPVCIEVPYELECDGVAILDTLKRYSEKQTLTHVIGYTDGSGEGVCGIEKSFNELLTRGNRVSTVTYSVDAQGRVLAGESERIAYNDYFSKNGVSLTIDAEIQSITEKALENSGFERGAVVVTDVETGAIRAMASAPVYDVNNISLSLDSESSPFLNRAMNAFSVGSVFKIVVAAAALEAGVPAQTVFECKGNVEQSGVVFNCHKRSGHGALDMRGALRESCNCYFINLAQLCSAEDIVELAYYMGFGTSLELCEGLVSDSGKLPAVESLDSAAAVANLAFGQGELLATPLQVAAATSVIASGGYYREPYLINSLVDENGKAYDAREPSFSQRVISQSTAEAIEAFLTNESVGNVTSAGKTSTSQSGVYSNGVEQLNTWYSGFFSTDSAQYVVTVLRENGESGLYDCRPVFDEIVGAVSQLSSFTEAW